MCQCWLAGGNVSISGQSRAQYISLGTSVEAPQPKSCNASCRRTWIDISYCGPVIRIEKMKEIISFLYHYSMSSLGIHQWNLVWCMGSSLGSLTTVASRDIRLQGIGVAVKHHAPTDVCPTSIQHQSKINSKKRSRRASFHLCTILSVIYKVF